jgi:pectate lyase
VTMRANELSLRKLTNGAITVLDSEPYTRQAGVPVKLRLEAVRDRVRVYVNGELRLEHAGEAIVPGKMGLMTYKASAAFENYVAYEP